MITRVTVELYVIAVIMRNTVHGILFIQYSTSGEWKAVSESDADILCE